MKGRKRALVVDTNGFVLRVAVHPANEQDRTGARLVLAKLPPNNRLKEIRADAGYNSEPLADWCAKELRATLSITQRDPQRKGFVVQKGRWVVERTFAWWGRYRRLSKDYEQVPLMCESFLYVASILTLLRYLDRVT